MSLGIAPWWLIVLAVIGAIALVTVFLSLFTAIGDRPASAEMIGSCQIGTREFLESLAGGVNAPLMEGGTARLLNNGNEIFAAMLDSIRSARESVNFMTYIWRPGELSDRMFDALTAKAREGVPVRIMIDAVGGHKAPEERIEEFRRAGGRWQWFHPARFGKLTVLHRRNHRRAVIIDGQVGYTGGFAVADFWLGDAESADHWRDAAVEVRGRIATNLQSAFVQLWSHATGEVLAGTHFFPVEQQADGRSAAGEPLSYHINVISSPSHEAHPLRRVFWMSFRSAARSIYITNPYFVPDDTMCAVLKERARAGVDVRVLVPNEHIDIALLRWASHAYYEELMEAGVRVYEYQPTMIHQKLLVIDGTWSIVGSANMDVRSKELNQENVLGIQDRGFAKQVEDTFFADLERATEIHLEEWRRRPFYKRVLERFAVLFEEQV